MKIKYIRINLETKKIRLMTINNYFFINILFEFLQVAHYFLK